MLNKENVTVEEQGKKVTSKVFRVIRIIVIGVGIITVAGAVGFSAGILLAPKSGEKMIKELNVKLQEIKNIITGW